MKDTTNRPWLKEFEHEPVGGFPGNPAFTDNWQLALRCAFNACLLGCIIWVPATKPYVGDGFANYVPLTILMIFFNIAHVFGCIVDNTTAVFIGTWWAFVNIFVMRGFFPDGVTHGMTWSSPASIAGWLDLMVYNFIFLSTDMRLNVRIFALAHHTGFMLSFLNPDDQTPFSKNWKIDPNGTAVNCLKVTVIACILTCLAHLLPYPFKFAKADMKDNARRVSAYVAKNFIGSVDYYKGSEANVLIEKQMKSTKVVEDEIGGLGASIGGAWWEGFDIGISGIIRNLHIAHSDLMGGLLDVCKAVEIAISTEDFAESHKTVMLAIGEATSALAESTGQLLMEATEAAGDGDISSGEAEDLRKLEEKVKEDIRKVAKDFDEIRRKWTPIHKELLNESFFVFALSAYSRKVIEYSTMLRLSPPHGDSMGAVICRALLGTFTLAGVGEGHWRIAIRSWLALLACFLYGVFFDGFGGACAITAVFLMSTRLSPDMKSTLDILLAVTIASCVGAIIFQRACQLQALVGGIWVLPLCCFFFWWLGMYVYFAGGTFSLIGLLMGALSAFVVVVRCPEDMNGSLQATTMWVRIRGFIIALFIMTLAEMFASKGALTKVAIEGIETAFQAIDGAFKSAWQDKDPSEALAPCTGGLADAKNYGMSAREEPRFWKSAWNYDLLMSLHEMCGYLKLDVQILRHGMCGADGQTGGVFEVLNKVKQFEVLQKDLLDTLNDARQISTDLLKHTNGKFERVDDLNAMQDIDSLDGFDETIEKVNEVEGFDFPPKHEVIETIEDDLLCQISIVFVMLEFGISRISNMIKSVCRNC